MTNKKTMAKTKTMTMTQTQTKTMTKTQTSNIQTRTLMTQDLISRRQKLDSEFVLLP